MDWQDNHWCEHCSQYFQPAIPATFTGYAFLICPLCNWRHPRRFEIGTAVEVALPPHGVKPSKFRQT